MFINKQVKDNGKTIHEDILDRYLQEIGKEERISCDEEVVLAKRIRNGDQEAVEKLAKANLSFVVSIAKQYQNQGLSLPDLINEGNIGLMKATTRFDETRGFKFISYAVWWIRQSILVGIKESNDKLRIPRNKHVERSKIVKITDDFFQKNERYPESWELAELLEITKTNIESALQQTKYLPLDAPLNADKPDKGSKKDNLMDTYIKEHETQKEFQEEITMVLNQLTKEERAIVKELNGIDNFISYEIKNAAANLGIKTSVANSNYKSAMKKLEKMKKNKQLEILRSFL